VFVFSSAWEGLGSVLLEALSTKTTVVSTDCPFGPREILADGKFGYLSPVGNENFLAKQIGKALDEPFCASVLEKRANFFNLVSHLDRFESLVNNSENKNRLAPWSYKDL
jgi:glycosyltransferase involved in cell wall biosynthesis